MAGQKVCLKCGVLLTPDNWTRSGRGWRMCKACAAAYQRDRCRQTDLCKQNQRNIYARLRREILDAYGNQCACCGESRQEFLSVDHVYGDGAAHRRSGDFGRGSGFYYWLRKQGYPQDRFRLLCMNCNFAHGQHGYCPHELEQKGVA